MKSDLELYVQKAIKNSTDYEITCLNYGRRYDVTYSFSEYVQNCRAQAYRDCDIVETTIKLIEQGSIELISLYIFDYQI